MTKEQRTKIIKELQVVEGLLEKAINLDAESVHVPSFYICNYLIDHGSGDTLNWFKKQMPTPTKHPKFYDLSGGWGKIANDDVELGFSPTCIPWFEQRDFDSRYEFIKYLINGLKMYP